MSEINSRMLDFIRNLGLSKSKFYQATGLSNGYLDKTSVFGSDKIEIIISTYPQLNVEWLLTGNGSMLKEDNSNMVVNEPMAYYGKDSRDETIEVQKKYIAMLEAELERYKEGNKKVA